MIRASSRSSQQLRRFIHSLDTSPRSCLSPRFLTYVRARPRTHPILHTVSSPSRTFTSSSTRLAAALSSHPPGQPTQLVSYPTSSDLEASEESDETEFDLVSPHEAKLELTERAAEQLRAIARKQSDDTAALRIAVESGGCHGYQYKMELATQQNPDDYHFSHPSVKPSNILIDAVSMPLLNGVVVDFATELIGSSFRILDNPQAKGSGCGCGVSWELKT